MSQYSLRGVKINIINIAQGKIIKEGDLFGPGISLVYPSLYDDVSRKGDIIEVLNKVGITHYDSPLFHKAPGLPFALMISHKLFTQKNQPYVVVGTNLGKILLQIKPYLFFQVQFWAAIVPLIFSLGTISITFLLGRFMFSYRVGIYAALMVAIHPVSMLSAQRIWNDDMVSFFMNLSLLLFYWGFKKRYLSSVQSLLLVFLSSIAFGLSILSKQTATVFIFAIWLFLLISYLFKDRFLGDDVKIPKKYFITTAFIFLLGAICVSGFWFLKVWKVFGNPFWFPRLSVLVKSDLTGWTQTLYRRPPGIILYPIGIVCLSPVFIFSWIGLFDFLRILLKRMVRRDNYKFLLLCTVVFVFFIFFGLGREHRRVLAVYPSLAIIGAYYLTRLRHYKTNFLRIGLGNMVIITIFTVSAIWSVYIGTDTILEGKLLFLIPF